MNTKNILFICVLFSSMSASTGSLGENLPLFSILPFIGLLLSIAIVPLIAPIFWHHNFGKISAFWAMSFLLPFIMLAGFDGGLKWINNLPNVECLLVKKSDTGEYFTGKSGGFNY